MADIERASGVAVVSSDATINLIQFGGLSPRTEPRLLRETMATKALDVDLLRGNLRPRRVPIDLGVPIDDSVGTIYLHCGEWLSYPGKVYLEESLGSDDRLYIVGDGVPRVRTCDGDEYELGIDAPPTELTLVLTDGGLVGYDFVFYGWYEGVDGQVYDRQVITPTQVLLGKDYEFVPFAATTAPDDAIFCTSVEVSKAGNLLGIAYSENSYRSGNSDLYIQGQQVVIRLFDRSGGSDTAYDGTTLPTLFGIKFDYVTTNSAALSRSYVYTYVRIWPDGTVDESAPSPATDLITVDATGAVVISGFVDPLRPDVTALRIYRTDITGAFRFVVELPLPATTYTDTLLDTELGELLPSEGWLPPPDDMGGVVSMPNGFMIGFAGNVLYPSALNQEHAFPAEFTKVIKGESIVGIAGAFENSLVVVTNCHPYIVTAYSPDDLTVTKVNATLPCVSALSMVDMGRYGVGYASTPGFVMVRAGDAPIMTEPFYTPEQWQALQPATMRSAWHDETLHVVSDVEHLIWDLSEGEDTLTTSRYLPAAMFSGCEMQRLWMVIEGSLKAWNEGDFGRFIWRSRESAYWRPVDFVRALVESAGLAEFRLYRDGVLVFSWSTVGDEPFTLPVLERSKYWQVEVESDVPVHRLAASNRHGRL